MPVLKKNCPGNKPVNIPVDNPIDFASVLDIY